MPKTLPAKDLRAIVDLLKVHPDGLPRTRIAEELGTKVPVRTLQYRLHYLTDCGLLVAEGQGPSSKYRTGPADPHYEDGGIRDFNEPLVLSDEGRQIQHIIQKPVEMRSIAGYNRKFLDSYRPNKSFYSSESDRSLLHRIGRVPIVNQPAGTFAREILDRFLIDLSWNSSRLEGNSYSEIDTKWLIEFGRLAEGKDQIEVQMILNHKDAIYFLVNEAQSIGFNRRTILSLHALLANCLLPNPMWEGRLRTVSIGITKSTFNPLGIPQVIEECFDQILNKAAAIKDPFEQSMFVLVHLPYLQPFIDINKRLSRLACNIPLVRANLIPLAFSEVPRDIYVQAILGVYELNRVELLRDVFLWAYKHSAKRYAIVRQTLVEPDPFRLKYREELRNVLREVILSQFSRADALRFIEDWASKYIPDEDRSKFATTACDQALALHEFNFARLRISLPEFEAWQKIWNTR